MIALFPALLLASAPCAVPDSVPAPNEALAGAGDSDWCLAGDDIFAVAGPDARPLRQIVVADESMGLFQVMQWRRGEPDAIPASWRVVDSGPGLDVARTPLHEILYQRFGAHIIVVTVNPAWRIGNAICSGEGGPSVAYLPAGIESSQEDFAVLEGLEDGLQQRSLGNILCTQFTLDGAGYAMRFRGPQGRPLPEIDDYYFEARARVTPAGDIEQLLGINR